MPPRTIDNLGPDVSERYAKDQSLIDSSYIKGAQAIPTRTEIDVSTPFFPGELEALLQLQPTHTSWAYFMAPAAYYEQRKRLFTFQLTPTLGPEGKWEAHSQKILDMLREEKEEPEQEEGKNKGQPAPNREKKVLTEMITAIGYLNKLIIDINCKKSQYQKG